MAFVEDIGEKTLKAVERIYVFILDILIRIVPFLSRAIERLQSFDREKLYPFFEKRDIEPKDYAVFKLQVVSGLFLIVSTLFIVNTIGARTYVIAGAVLLLLILYILFFTIKKGFEEFTAYRDLFLSFICLVLLLAVVKIKKPVVTMVFPFFHFTVIAVSGSIAIYVYFSKRHSRDYTRGRVVAVDGPDIKVRFNYDIRSNVKPQTALFRNTMNAREGDIVKVGVKKGLLSLRGSIPDEIIGVEWA